MSVPGDPAKCDRCNVARIVGRAQCREHARRAAVAAGDPDALAGLDNAIAAESRRANRNMARWAALGGARLAALPTGRPSAPVCPPGEHLDVDGAHCLVCGGTVTP